MSARSPLIDFADRWELDGDYLRCRACNRPQIIGCANMDFPHVSGCVNAGAESSPWKTLGSLINAGISKALYRPRLSTRPAQIGPDGAGERREGK